jgi:molybdate transport system substrate-binding protein
LIWLAAFAVVAVLGGGCGTSAAGATTIEIFAAASLSAPLEAAKAAYESSHPGVRLTVALDSSAALRTQIEHGAPADVFLSADTTNPQRLVDAGVAVGPVTLFAGNHLAIVVPKSDRASITEPADLARPGVRIVAAGDSVPITSYATKLIEQLAALPGYSPDFVAAYEANVVSREDNVRAIVAKLELGEADAGIVYVTDALGSDAVSTVKVPDSANVVATYGAVVVKASPDAAASTAFLTWLGGPEGQAILARFGFVAPA